MGGLERDPHFVRYMRILVQRLPSLALLGGFPSEAPIPVRPFWDSGASLYAAPKSGGSTRPRRRARGSGRRCSSAGCGLAG